MAAKERFCWCCGESMGVIESRYYDRMDTCGKAACLREEQDAHRAEREQAHEELDERMGW